MWTTSILLPKLIIYFITKKRCSQQATPQRGEAISNCLYKREGMFLLLLAMMGTGTTLATVATLGALATGTCGTLLVTFGFLKQYAV